MAGIKLTQFVLLSHRFVSRAKFYRCFSVSAAHRTTSHVGFIGLGNMGSRMAENLLKGSHSLIVYDLYPDSVKHLTDQGASSASSPAEVSEKCDRIITMLPSNAHVIEVYTGENGIFSKVKPGTLLIDSSTIDPSISTEINHIAEKKGAVFMDAPVSGGVNAAKSATLTFMVGGKEAEVEAAKQLLLCMGKNVVHCGDVGSGEAVKICNNMMLAISMIGTAETMNFGIRLGLDPKVLGKVLNMSSGRTWPSEVYNPVPGVMENVPSSNNYEGGFGTSLMAKDLSLAQAAATRTLSPTPLGSAAFNFYRLMMNCGYGNKDFSSCYMFLKDGGLSNNKK